MPRIAENTLIVPTLKLLDDAPNGEMATTEIIDKLTASLNPKGEDAKILDGRHDTKFSQKVRNLKCHKTLEKLGFAEDINDGFQITDAGRNKVREH